MERKQERRQGQPCDEGGLAVTQGRQNVELEERQRRVQRPKCVSAWSGTAGGFSLVEDGFGGMTITTAAGNWPGRAFGTPEWRRDTCR